MGKSELLDVILRDIKELELITQGMREMDKVPGVVRDLAKTKALNVYDGFCHINEASSQVFSDQLQKTRGIELSTCTITMSEPETVVAVPEVEAPTLKKESLEVQKPMRVETKLNVEQENPVSVRVETTNETERLVVRQETELKAPEPTMEKAEEPVVAEKIESYKQTEKQEFHSEAYPYCEKNKESDKKGTVIANTSNGLHKSITNERFRTNVKSLNETVSVGRKPEGRFVNSLKKAINLNDRFRYRKELFGGDADLMNKTIDTLEEMDSFDRAMEYLLSQFSWDLNSQTAGDFVAMLEARFS